MIALTLASQSRARGDILRHAGVAFAACVSGVDEESTKRSLLARGASPAQVATALADEKALAVSAQRPGLVIGADQTLDLDGSVFDKPASLAEARDRLIALRGRAHALRSAVTIARDGEVAWRDLQTAWLSMRAFSDAFLDRYLSRIGEKVLSSVGCYQLEGEGAQLFEAIDGDYFTILGLPLWGLLGFLRDEGVLET
jgi:septum formation protein